MDQIEASEKLMAELNQSWEQKLERTKEIQKTREVALEEMGIAIKEGEKGTIGLSTPQKLPHLINLNEDPLMSECLIYYIKEGVTRVGTHQATVCVSLKFHFFLFFTFFQPPRLPTNQVPQDIQLQGLNVLGEHCIFEYADGAVKITPFENRYDFSSVPQLFLKVLINLFFAPNNSLTYVNGKQITQQTDLFPGFRVVIGNNHIFRFNNPEQARKLKAEGNEPQLGRFFSCL